MELTHVTFVTDKSENDKMALHTLTEPPRDLGLLSLFSLANFT